MAKFPGGAVKILQNVFESYRASLRFLGSLLLIHLAVRLLAVAIIVPVSGVVLAAMLTLRPDWTHGILAATAVGNLSALETDFLAVNTGQVSLGLIRRIHAQDRKLYVWTVNDPVTMVRLNAWSSG